MQTFGGELCMPCQQIDSNMILLKFQVEKYVGSSMNKLSLFACVCELQVVACPHQSFTDESLVTGETEMLRQKEKNH